MEKEYYVYITASLNCISLYTGVTNSLSRRIFEHKFNHGSKFTSRYKASRLVYYEIYGDPTTAIRREKQIKAGSRAKKIKLIESMNSDWKDLFDDV